MPGANPIIAVVTPLKDELANLPRLVAAMQAQTLPVDLWVIVENDSVDGSREYLRNLGQLSGVKQLQVLERSFADKAYRLGRKYSMVVNLGFKNLRSNYRWPEFDYIGILDADCIPDPDFFERLAAHFLRDPGLGIVSGVIRYHDDSLEKNHPDQARGGCRLWRRRCFEECPYEIGLSADSIASARAVLAGWRVASFSDAVVRSRRQGVRFVSTYQGRSAYYRHIPFYYVLLRTPLLFFRAGPRSAAGYLFGFLQAMLTRAERLSDPALAHYFRRVYPRKKLFRSRRS